MVSCGTRRPWLTNTTKRPVADIDGSKLSSFPCPPSDLSDTRRVVAVARAEAAGATRSDDLTEARDTPPDPTVALTPADPTAKHNISVANATRTIAARPRRTPILIGTTRPPLGTTPFSQPREPHARNSDAGAGWHRTRDAVEPCGSPRNPSREGAAHHGRTQRGPPRDAGGPLRPIGAWRDPHEHALPPAPLAGTPPGCWSTCWPLGRRRVPGRVQPPRRHGVARRGRASPGVRDQRHRCHDGSHDRHQERSGAIPRAPKYVGRPTSGAGSHPVPTQSPVVVP